MSARADRLAFLRWATGHPGLSPNEHRVLSFVVLRLAGSCKKDNTPYRGWAKFQVLVDGVGCCERTVRRVLIRLEQRGWIVRTSVHGIGGRIYIDLPLAPGAADRLKGKPFGKAEGAAWQDALPSKTHHGRRVSDGENPPDSFVENPDKVAGFTPSKTLQNLPEAPSKTLTKLQGDSLDWPANTLDWPTNTLDWADHVGAEAGAAGFENGVGDGLGLRQESKPTTTEPMGTQPMVRLLKRVRGAAIKGGITLDLTAFTAEVGKARLDRWIRLQREERGRDDSHQLMHEVVEAIVSHTGCDPSAFGAAVGTKPPPRKATNGHKSNGFNPYADEHAERPPPRPTLTREQVLDFATRYGVQKPDRRQEHGTVHLWQPGDA